MKIIKKYYCFLICILNYIMFILNIYNIKYNLNVFIITNMIKDYENKICFFKNHLKLF